MITLAAMGPRFLQQARAETLTATPTDAAGNVLVASAATYTLLDSDGTAVIDAAAATVAGTGVVSYSLAADFADAYTLPQTEWRERWALTGLPNSLPNASVEREVYLCRVAPSRHVDLGALVKLHPQWARLVPGSRTASRKGDPVDLAWDEMIARLLGDGVLPHRILNWYAFSIVHFYWAASLIARDFSSDIQEASRWERFAEAYWDRSQSEYERIVKAKIDDDEDGIADRSGVEPSAGGTPRRWRWA